MQSITHASTGIRGLDTVIDDLRIGDNVVWQVDAVADYRAMARAFADRALSEGRRVVYLRFARHKPLLEPGLAVTTHVLDAEEGFESFSTEVHRIVTQEGPGTFYVFDCLSDLLYSWVTDLMVGNFFVITCPYLFELDTVAYFGLLRDHHSYRTVARIRETTQVLLDLYNAEGQLYIQPLKVWNRYSPTMFFPQRLDGEDLEPVTDSVDVSNLARVSSRRWADSAAHSLDNWDRFFLEAEKLLSEPVESRAQEEMVAQLARIMMTREPTMLSLITDNFYLHDLLDIKERIIGSGFVGGKTAGMLLARKILDRDEDFDWRPWLEAHDSFYIGSDVFYTYIVTNGWWPLLMEHKTPEGYFAVARELGEKFLSGRFSADLKEEFFRVVEYFGQSPIIIRSSSLLEDSFGHAFAGKYESIFLANQGSPEERYAAFEQAVRRIFASTMGEDALIYRRKRGLENRDEQMALLVQRVSGANRGTCFFPDLAGVGVSRNTFAWQEDMDPAAGMLRLVCGLGTRAVDRVEDDYPRIIALDRPLIRPSSLLEDIRTYAQRDVDLIDLAERRLATRAFNDLVNQGIPFQLEEIATYDEETTHRLHQLGRRDEEAWILTFDQLLSRETFAPLMQRLMRTLETRYRYPVDIEFTVNFTPDAGFHINLVQCRPLQTRGPGPRVEIPGHLDEELLLFRVHDTFMGGNTHQQITTLIAIDATAYADLALQDKYTVARIIGELGAALPHREDAPTMILGPGRWGSTTPELGIPVGFAEISNMAVLVEVADVGTGLMPDLSYGSHFFQDLVETDIFYVAINPGTEGVIAADPRLPGHPNQLPILLPEYKRFAGVISVLDLSDTPLTLLADVVSRQVVCLRGEGI